MEYALIERGNYYGPSNPLTLISAHETLAEAELALRQIESNQESPYRCGHNEAGSPAFLIATIRADFHDRLADACEYAADLLPEAVRADLPEFDNEDFGEALADELTKINHALLSDDRDCFIVELPSY